MDALELLTDADLGALAGALRSGRLHPPFTAVSVQRFSSRAHADAVAALFQKLHEEGMAGQHLALLVETVSRTRANSRGCADAIDLVWTGPEALGLTNRDTGVVVRELFGEAEQEVLVAGFAVYQGRAVFKRLAERMGERPALRVSMFLDVQRPHHDSSVGSEVIQRFVHRFRTQEWPGERLPDLYFDPRSLDLESSKRSSLHAKCVVVDRRIAFVTSANFTEAAQTRNIEVGALIREPGFAAQLATHFDTLVETGCLHPLPG